MSDNVYRVLFGDNAPFNGLANLNYFDRTIKGVIEKVHYNLIDKTLGKDILNQYAYRTVDIRWLEAKPYISKNVHIPELISFNGYGLNYLPSKGDIVYASFDSNNDPIITNIVSRCSAYEHGVIDSETGLPKLNNYGDPLLNTVIPEEIRPTPIRYIIPGEISLISINFAELYLDKNGACKLIVREQNDTRQMGDRLWELSLGQKIINESDNTLKTYNNKNIEFQLLGHKNNFVQNILSDGSIYIQNNNWTIDCDTNNNLNIKNKLGDTLSINNGNITFKNNLGDSIEIAGGQIKVGTNAKEPMVLGDSLKFFIDSIVSIFNSHTHIGNLGDPTSKPNLPIISQDFLSKKVKVE